MLKHPLPTLYSLIGRSLIVGDHFFEMDCKGRSLLTEVSSKQKELTALLDCQGIFDW